MKSIHLNPSLEIPFKQKRTGKDFSLRLADGNFKLTRSDYDDITRICNQKEIYQRLMFYRVNNRPYTKSDAKDFVDEAKKRLQRARGYVFFILDDQNRVSGVIDINTSKPVSRIGYWNSKDNPGVMANALKALCKNLNKTGYKQLFATPNPDNIASKKVLLRASFKPRGKVNAWNKEKWTKYVVTLVKPG